MKKLFLCLTAIASLAYSQVSWQLWKEIPVPYLEIPGYQGFGNFIPVDLDKDGMPEIVAVNNNTIDEGDLSPRMYIYKYNSTTQQWDSIWGYQSDIPLQNTWPPLEIGDMDGDGKLEVIWCPINYTDATSNPNPARIIVFEVNSEGTLGVSDGFGGYLPNTSWTIFSSSEGIKNMRPFQILLKDIDGDGKDELIIADRAPAGAGYHFAFFKVSDVPDNGSGSETWTNLANGTTVSHNFTSAAKYDIINFGDEYFFIDASAGVCHVKYNKTTQTFSTKPRYVLSGLAAGSWKSACKVDIDKDGEFEYVFGEWMNTAKSAKVVLVKYNQAKDSLESYIIGNYFDSDSLTGLNGGAAGDIDGDGKIDFVFGTRGLRSYTYDNGIYGFSYMGGDITDPASYRKYKIAGNYFTQLYENASDSIKNIYKNHGQWDVIRIADLTGDGLPEILVTSTYPRGNPDDPAPILIYTATGTSVEEKIALPKEFYLAQNYPNPFNPTTNIRFYLPKNATVDLKIYNVLGQEVAAILNKANLTSGEHTYTFNAGNLPSGVYFIKLTDGVNSQIRKMTLVK